MVCCLILLFFFFSSRRRHTRSTRDWSSDVCSSDLDAGLADGRHRRRAVDADGLGARRECLRSEEHTSELQSRVDLVCRLLLEKKKKNQKIRRASKKTKRISKE